MVSACVWLAGQPRDAGPRHSLPAAEQHSRGGSQGGLAMCLHQERTIGFEASVCARARVRLSVFAHVLRTMQFIAWAAVHVVMRNERKKEEL